MKTKAKGLEAAKLEILQLQTWTLAYEYMWELRIKGVSPCQSARFYTTRRGARKAAYLFARKLEISMKSVEVVE